MVRCSLSFAALSLLLAASGCAQGQRAALPPEISPQAHLHIPVTLELLVPRGGTSGADRRRDYVSPATQAITVNNQAFNVSTTSPGCVTQASGLACTFTVDAPNIGGAGFNIVTYDMPLAADGTAQGNILSMGYADATINAGQANVVKATLYGLPVQVSFSIANLSPPIGQQETTPVNFQVKDADGYTIVGEYARNVFLAFQGGVSYGLQFIVNGINIASAQIKSPSDVVSLEYFGSGVTSTTIVGSNGATNVYSATFSPVPNFGAETPIATSLVGSDVTVTSDGRDPAETWYTEPAKHMLAHVGQYGTDEFALPSGGAPSLLASEGIIPTDGVLVSETGSSNYAAINFLGATPKIYENPLPAGETVYQLAATSYDAMTAATNPAGKIDVWYSDPNTNAMDFTEIPTSVANSSPAGIVPDSNAFYFADTGASAIGVVGFDKSIKYYPLPSPGAAPTRISINVNWNLAVVEPGVSKVAFFTDPSRITEYACSGVPANVAMGTSFAAVLLTNGNIDVIDVQTGARTSYTPPPSSAGPVVAMSQGDGDVILLRSNGVVGSMQHFYYW